MKPTLQAVHQLALDKWEQIERSTYVPTVQDLNITRWVLAVAPLLGEVVKARREGSLGDVVIAVRELCKALEEP